MAGVELPEALLAKASQPPGADQPLPSRARLHRADAQVLLATGSVKALCCARGVSRGWASAAEEAFRRRPGRGWQREPLAQALTG